LAAFQLIAEVRKTRKCAMKSAFAVVNG